MARFRYQAITASGKSVKGVVEAETDEAAEHQLAARGLVPLQLNGESEGPRVMTGLKLPPALGSTVGAPELILFTKQLRTMIRAGIPMLTILEILERQVDNPRLRAVIRDMAHDIREGAGLSDVFRKHPRVFSPLYCSMIHAGEASGALPTILDRLIYIIDHEHKVRCDVRNALQYPLIVIGFLGTAFFILLTFVIPKFVTIFKSAGLKLPLPTRICIALYDLIATHWMIMLAGLCVGAGALVLYVQSPSGRLTRDTALMRLPLVGPLFVKAAMARFSAIFGILQASGVAILESMRILSGTIGNHAIAREIDRIREHLQEGRGISTPLRGARYFPPMVTGMVAVGEESGNLDEMLREVAAHYDAEVEHSVKRLSESIGPILTIGLAAMVGFFALAIFLPMWDLTRMVK
jgi:type IV pilus assembly protein PilC